MAKLQGLLWAGLVLGVLLLLDTTYRQVFHDSSAALTALLQKTSCGFTDFVFKAIDVVSLWLVMLIPVYCYASEGSRTGVPMLVTAIASIGLNGVLKVTFHEERPFWEYGEVTALKCTKGWGNPSGHSQMCAAVYGLYAYYAYSRSQKALMWTLLAGIGIVGYDRLYLGVHFYNQVALGWAFAAVTVCVILCLKLEKEKKLPWLLVASYLFTAFCFVMIAFSFVFTEPYWDRTWSYRLYIVKLT